MKRVSDNQLTKDSADYADGDEEVGTGFKRADDAVLATRKIRGLPKRSGMAAAAAAGGAPSAPMPMMWNPGAVAAPAEKAPEPVSKFAGFGGFGAPVAAPAPPPASSTFTFGKPSSTAPAPAPAPAPAATTMPSFFGSAPSTAPSTTTAGASSSAKTFASFLGPATSTPAQPPKPTTNGTTTTTASAGFQSPFGSTSKFETSPPKASTALSSPSSTEDKAQVDYYVSLRGLNVSILNAIKKYTEEDAFVDLSEMFERYKTLRAGIQKDYDSKKPGAASASISSSAATASTGAPSSAPSKFTMPVPPAGGISPSFFGDNKAGTSSSSSTTPSLFGGASSSAGGVSFKVPTTSSSSSGPMPFVPPSIPSKPTEPTTTPSSSTSNGFTPPGGSAFGGITFGAPATSAPAAPSAGFTFGPPASSSAPAPSPPSSGLPFSLKPSAPADSGAAAPKSFFSTGTDQSKDTSPPKEKKDEEEKKPIVFGGSTMGTSSSGPFGLFGKGSGQTPGFTFGSGSTSSGGEAAKKPAEFSFGKPSSSGSLFGGASGSTGFSFAGTGSASGTSAISSTDKKEDAPASGEGEAGEAKADDAAPTVASMLGVNPHDEEGKGEEDEETVHAVKCKAFRMKKGDEKGGSGWIEVGHGILRLKSHKENGDRRMLLRNSTTGKINLNFKLYSGLKPSILKKAVTFIGHDNGTAQTYSVRVPTEENAKELKEALEREVAFIKAKEAS